MNLGIAVVCLILMASPLVAGQTVNQTADTSGVDLVTVQGLLLELNRICDDAYLSDTTESTFFITVDTLHNMISDSDTSNDPFIVDVRGPEHYTLGHIPGAINIPWTQIMDEDNLAKIPQDNSVVVYCYTGQCGAAVTVLLGTMGYNVKNLKFGMQAWTDSTTVNPKRYNPEIHCKNYPFDGTEA